MEFQLLGAFEARHQGRPVLGSVRRQERCLLAVLLLCPGRAVTTERLIDLLWDGAAPASARGTVHTYVGRLRAALRPYGPRIGTRHDGYALDPAGAVTDAGEFIRLVREAAAATDPAERVRLQDRALALWRGPLLAGTAGDRLRDRLGGELEELRLSTLEQRAGTQLDMGLHDRVAAGLAAPAREHPEREGLVARRMTALYRSGRQSEALELYRETRGALAERFGVEPGEGLRGLHERVLRGDPGLDRPPAPVHAVRVRGEWLPWSTGGHPALEFCNTYAGWGGPRRPGSEWLRGYRTLAVWAGHLDLTEDHLVSRLTGRARQRPDEAAAALAEAREFRADLYACLTDPGDARAFKAVAAVAEEAAGLAEFVRGEDGLGLWRLSPAAGLRLPLLAVARSAAELLSDARRFTVRACPGPDCGWLFPDRSGQRRWCSLGTCGSHRPQ
ncbi:winged helix-turn-helix domain-containing protein [Streptomyces sp. S07_1.15]|uniref:BTAD domain-containing putative transcriptional regulator n=1 Tax=Streptomyces sp. S07_1.15 TaxID=2873925 RepID=UPI001D1435E1|nr:BTAD domain-containing putative transcriptional regulator [Streptomyces sp. S07_1.15]MCC3655682.1 winged helix-turn-helix domain-containing protein [Streptomyces sp. S07_1.15]